MQNIKELIHELTTDIITMFDIHIPIVNIDDVVKKLNGTVIERFDMSEFDCFVERTGENKFAINISANISTEMKNWKVAQMLGELFMQMFFLIDETHFNSYGLHKKHIPENNYQYVNEFAAAILMPKVQYMQQFNINLSEDGKTVNTKNIADYFHVKTSDAHYRGVCLGILRNF